MCLSPKEFKRDIMQNIAVCNEKVATMEVYSRKLFVKLGLSPVRRKVPALIPSCMSNIPGASCPQPREWSHTGSKLLM